MVRSSLRNLGHRSHCTSQCINSLLQGGINTAGVFERKPDHAKAFFNFTGFHSS